MKKAGKWIVLLIVAALLVLIAMRFMKKKEVVEEETRPTVAVGLPETRDIINLTTAIGTKHSSRTSEPFFQRTPIQTASPGFIVSS